MCFYPAVPSVGAFEKPNFRLIPTFDDRDSFLRVEPHYYTGGEGINCADVHDDRDKVLRWLVPPPRPGRKALHARAHAFRQRGSFLLHSALLMLGRRRRSAGVVKARCFDLDSSTDDARSIPAGGEPGSDRALSGNYPEIL